MKRTLLVLAAVLLVLPAPARAEDPATPAPVAPPPGAPPPGNVHQALIAAKAPPIVAFKLVISMTTPRGPQEFNQAGTGVVVDASGLIMISVDDLNPERPAQFPAAMWRSALARFKITPTNIRVVFPGDETEYPAILGAKDTKLGLAFLLIKDLKDRVLEPVDMSKNFKPVVGDKLYGVTRLGQGFDHAPMCDTAKVVGELTKPRKVMLLARAGNFVAMPLYDKDGAVAGVVIDQEGATSEAGSRVCLLPLGVAKSTIERSLKAAQDALDEALEAEAEAAEEAKEAESAKKDDADAGKEEGDAKKDEGDAKKDEPKKDEPKKDEPKKDAPKKDAPKKGDGE